MTRFECIAISDIHLGSDELDRQQLIEFLNTHHADLWVIVGDLFDNLNLLRFTSQDVQILKILRSKNENGELVVVVEGNHEGSRSKLKKDYLSRHYLLSQLLPVHWTDEYLTYFGGEAVLFNHGHTFFEPNIWSTAIYRLYRKVMSYNKRLGRQILRQLTKFLGRLGVDFSREEALEYAQEQEVKAIICGHTHIASMDYMEGVWYGNCGTWTDLAYYDIPTWIGIDRYGKVTLYNAKDVVLEHFHLYDPDEV